ncbi:hypothetical protein [Paenibacillus sp.]|uniref:hypothetical protein n=1 Tax=Paenibacillus sp. TaxID=58172 RepID=UPI002812867A|nr:hypothetical protein [Paenibacillus sp.]
MQETDTTKPELAPVPIWRCRSADCKAWVRDELVSEPPPKRGRGAKKGKGAMTAAAAASKGANRAPSSEAATESAPPVCPLCKGPMLRGMKHLPKLVKKAKAAPKKSPENGWLH